MNKKKPVNSSALIFIILYFTAFTAGAQKISFDAEPLAAGEAFQLDHIVTGPSEAVIRWQIPQFYYLYKEKISFSSNDLIIEDVQFPTAQIKDDPFFGAIEVYHDVLEATLKLTPVNKNQKERILNITYQGCWEGGICYPLLKKSLTLSGL
ncbi:MAG: protein-disulfide reductase DsbD domain-containing protein [SAR324 cluster bacterium]|nr:protein-disulfide reductase DsbD domain-containing protein [SAR324 cluster bacterium]